MLRVLVGPPASGKSTHALANAKEADIANGIPDTRWCGDAGCDLNGLEHGHGRTRHPVFFNGIDPRSAGGTLAEGDRGMSGWFAFQRVDRRKPDWYDWWFRAIVAFVVVVLGCTAFGVAMSIRQSTRFWNGCHDAGGHIVDTGTGRICVSEDGRVIER